MRDEWNARPPRSMTRQSPPVTAFLHHSSGEDGKQFATLATQRAHVRAIQDFHMDSHGWSDIGYALMVFQYVGVHDIRVEPRVYQCRLTKYVPAAQLGHNTRTLPICVVGNGDRETLHEETCRVIAALIRSYPSVTMLRPHGAVTQTDCPGAKFRAEIPHIARHADVAH